MHDVHRGPKEYVVENGEGRMADDIEGKRNLEICQIFSGWSGGQNADISGILSLNLLTLSNYCRWG